MMQAESGIMANPIEQQGPLSLSMLVCDDVMVDALTGKESIVGKFDVLHASAFPALHPKLVVLAELTDGRGESPTDIRFVQCLAEEDKVLGSVTIPLVFSDPLAVLPIRVVFQNLIFPLAGEYRFQLYFRGEILAERRIIVKELPKEPQHGNT